MFLRNAPALISFFTALTLVILALTNIFTLAPWIIGIIVGLTGFLTKIIFQYFNPEPSDDE